MLHQCFEVAKKGREEDLSRPQKLLFACAEGDLTKVRDLVLKKGVDPDSKEEDVRGLRPLHFAACCAVPGRAGVFLVQTWKP